MTRQAMGRESDRAWRWAALLLGAVVLGLGCSPANLAFLLMPFEPPTPAECDLVGKNKKKETTVVVLVSYASSPEITPELLTADQELSDRFVTLLRKRIAEKKLKIKIVPPHLVKAFQNSDDSWRTMPMVEVGKKFHADKVVNLEINYMSLFEKNSRMIFKGSVDIQVTVTPVNHTEDEPEGEVLHHPYLLEYPKMKIIPADSPGGIAYFRSYFIDRIATELVDLFTPHEVQVGGTPMDS